MGWTPPTGPAPKRRIEVSAPAKVNLYLGVHPNPITDDAGRSRHLVDTVMHTVSLADTVVLELLPRTLSDPAGDIECVCMPALDIPSDQNLAVRAIRAFAERLGRPRLCGEDERLRLTISKQVPTQAGLGGGSSDAAAAILAAATLWGEDALGLEAHEAARSLGSDIPFFLEGGALRMEGFGDIIAERLDPLDGILVIVKPDAGVSTGACYAAFDASPTEPADLTALLQSFALPATAANRTRRLGHAALSLANNLSQAAEGIVPELASIREWLEGQPGVLSALLSGSGSATFAVCGTESAAFETARAAQARGWFATPAWLSAKGVQVVDDRRAMR